MRAGSPEGGHRAAAARAALAEILGTDDPEALDEVGEHVEWLDLPSGEFLYRQGDAADSVHVLVRGRLRAVTEDARGAPRVLGEIGRGETVGEMALLNGGARTASVVAVRESLLLGLRREAVEKVMLRHPRLAVSVARLAVERMRRALHERRRAARVRSLALIPHGRFRGLEAFAKRLATCLEAAGSVAMMNASDSAGASPEERIRRLDEKETECETLLLVAESTSTPWTRACLRHADVVLVVAEAGDEPSPGSLERSIPETSVPGGGPSRVLVLLHDPGTTLPRRTATWLEPRPRVRHHHVRHDHEGDIRRVARFLVGKATGLVLAGGGAPGLAHLGVIRALREKGVSIDAVGGTSIGALLAAAVARDWDGTRLVEEARAAFSKPDPLGDWHVPPVVSISRGRRMTDRILDRFGDAAIEDLWLPFFCISANLTSYAEHVHRRGPLSKALRTSASIPGVLPPMVYDDHLHVDGSCVNNLPVDVMFDEGVGRVIASDLDLRVDRKLGYEQVPSSWAILRGRFLPGARRYPVPGLVSVVMKSTLLGGAHRAALSRDDADLSLVLPVGKIGLLHWHAFDRVVDLGYRYASERLAEVDPGRLG